MQINERLDKKFSLGIKYILETTRCECLHNYSLNKEHLKSDNSGLLIHVGNINGDESLGVRISIWIEEFKGLKYLCYEPSSLVVDHRLICAWLDFHFKGVKRTDMMNYHHIIHEANKERLS